MASFINDVKKSVLQHLDAFEQFVGTQVTGQKEVHACFDKDPLAEERARLLRMEELVKVFELELCVHFISLHVFIIISIWCMDSCTVEPLSTSVGADIPACFISECHV